MLITMRIFLVLITLIMMVGCKDAPEELSAEESYKQREKRTMEVARMNGCLKCHDINRHVLGPAWKYVAERYKNDNNARSYLIEKVKKGSTGVWDDLTGGAVMPPNSPRVSDAHIERIVDFILTLDDGVSGD